MQLDKLFQKSESFNQLLSNTEKHFTQKFPSLSIDNELEFTIEVSHYRKKLYNYYKINPAWSVGSYRDMFDLREAAEATKARHTLKEQQDMCLLYSHYIGEDYILDKEEREYIDNLKLIIAQSEQEIILKKPFLNAIIEVFKSNYAEPRVMPLLHAGWGERVQENQERSKKIAKELFLRLTEGNNINYNLMRNVKNTKLKG